MIAPRRAATAEPIDEGVQAGIARAGRYFSDVPYGTLDDHIASTVRQVLEAEPSLNEALDERFTSTVRQVLEVEPSLSGRSIELFVETATVAAISRSEYKDEPVTEGMLVDFIRPFVRLLNSWTHE